MAISASHGIFVSKLEGCLCSHVVQNAAYVVLTALVSFGFLFVANVLVRPRKLDLMES